MRFDDALDLRYVGQDYYLRVYVDIDDLDGERIRSDFDRLHEHTYGFSTIPSSRSRWSTRGSSPSARSSGRSCPRSTPAARPTRRCKRRRGARSSSAVPSSMTAIYDVTALRADDEMDGPCVIEDPRSTIVVMPGQTATVDRFRNLTIEAVA